MEDGSPSLSLKDQESGVDVWRQEKTDVPAKQRKQTHSSSAFSLPFPFYLALTELDDATSLVMVDLLLLSLY